MHSSTILLILSSLSVASCHSVPASARVGPRASGYPAEDVPGPAPKQAWIDTYNAAKAKGLIPGIAPSVMVNGNPTYAAGVNTGTSGVCSWTVSHCFGAYDVVDAPNGNIGIAFDDGPQLASPTLYNFLQQNQQSATHFMIGSRILDNPSIFQQAVSSGGHIAIHTWSHPYMTSLTDLQIVGELGWTAQIIQDQSGLVPAFWRPPYGDIDNRVRAIAREVFGLYNVIWSLDTDDWCLTEGGGSSCVGFGPANDAALDAELQGFYHLSHTPGIIILEHELTTRSVGGFIRNYPTIQQQGWVAKDIPNLWGVPGYQSVATVAAGRNPSWAAATNTSSSSSSPVSSPGSSSGSGSSSTPVSSSASATVSTSAPAIIPSVTRTESFNETVIIPTPTSLGANVTAQTPASQSTAVSTSRTGGAGTLAMGGLSLVLGGLLMTGLATLV